MSLHLGSIRGTTIEIDPSFLILIAFFVAVNIEGPETALKALVWAPILFASVLLHELAHAAMIGILGHGPSQILLGGLGGVTINKRQAPAWQQVLISAAGPASSFALCWVSLWIYRHVGYVKTDPFLMEFLPNMVLANLWWGIFNLLPIGPLDGASVTRNLLRIVLPERPAFAISVWISMIVGVLSIIVAIVWLRMFIFAAIMAMFVFRSYQQWVLFRAYRKPEDDDDHRESFGGGPLF